MGCFLGMVQAALTLNPLHFQSCVKQLLDLLHLINSPEFLLPKSGPDIITAMDARRKEHKKNLTTVQSSIKGLGDFRDEVFLLMCASLALVHGDSHKCKLTEVTRSRGKQA